jgi:hypothetical protein
MLDSSEELAFLNSVGLIVQRQLIFFTLQRGLVFFVAQRELVFLIAQREMVSG